MLDGYKTIIAAGIAFAVELLSKLGLDVGQLGGVPALTDAVVLIGTALAVVFRFTATKNLRTGKVLE